MGVKELDSIMDRWWEELAPCKLSKTMTLNTILEALHIFANSRHIGVLLQGLKLESFYALRTCSLHSVNTMHTKFSQNKLLQFKFTTSGSIFRLSNVKLCSACAYIPYMMFVKSCRYSIYQKCLTPGLLFLFRPILQTCCVFLSMGLFMIFLPRKSTKYHHSDYGNQIVLLMNFCEQYRTRNPSKIFTCRQIPCLLKIFKCHLSAGNLNLYQASREPHHDHSIIP